MDVAWGGRSSRMVDNAAANSKSAETGYSQPVSKETDRSRILNLSYDQWEALVNMFNSSKGQSSSNEKLNGKFAFLDCCINDTGCSNHMTGNAKLFTKLFDVTSTVIGLPNGITTADSK